MWGLFRVEVEEGGALGRSVVVISSWTRESNDRIVVGTALPVALSEQDVYNMYFSLSISFWRFKIAYIREYHAQVFCRSRFICRRLHLFRICVSRFHDPRAEIRLPYNKVIVSGLIDKRPGTKILFLDNGQVFTTVAVCSRAPPSRQAFIVCKNMANVVPEKFIERRIQLKHVAST